LASTRGAWPRAGHPLGALGDRIAIGAVEVAETAEQVMRGPGGGGRIGLQRDHPDAGQARDDGEDEGDGERQSTRAQRRHRTMRPSRGAIGFCS
jgi:hypothetical protein